MHTKTVNARIFQHNFVFFSLFCLVVTVCTNLLAPFNQVFFGFVSSLPFCLYLFCFASRLYGLRLSGTSSECHHPFCQDAHALASKRLSVSEVNRRSPDAPVTTIQTEDHGGRPVGHDNWRQLSLTAGAAAASILLLPPPRMAHFVRLALL